MDFWKKLDAMLSYETSLPVRHTGSSTIAPSPATPRSALPITEYHTLELHHQRTNIRARMWKGKEGLSYKYSQARQQCRGRMDDEGNA